MKSRTIRAGFAMSSVAVALAVAFPPLARAQNYPAKPIRLMVPFPPGGPADILSRVVAKRLSEQMGQAMVIENRAGAGGTSAMEIVAKSPGDGYTLELVAMGHATNPLVYKHLPYDSDKDFTPVSLIATFPQLVMVNPKVPASSLKELLALAKKASPQLTYASGGNGSSQHFAGA